MPALPQPEGLTRNGSFLAYLRLEEHVGTFRDFLVRQFEFAMNVWVNDPNSGPPAHQRLRHLELSGRSQSIDWGVGKVLGEGLFDVGVSGFAAWQLTEQSGGASAPEPGRYRYFGIGPEASMTAWSRCTFRVRAQWEFAGRNAVRGNNLWLIVNYAR